VSDAPPAPSLESESLHALQGHLQARTSLFRALWSGFCWLVLGCASAGSGLECQLENRGHEWFEGSSYDACMRLREEQRRARAKLERLDASCDDGDRAACLEAGGTHQEHEPVKALHQFEEACEGGLTQGCAGAARLRERYWPARSK
jgi:hypothetical protein